MKKILHLSDLHFGTEKPGIVDLLIQDCKQLNPDIIIISGDLTQRATNEQYQAVKDFLLNFKEQILLCVPGNHDISLYNPIERFIYPFAKYQKWISSSLCNTYADDKLSIIGINSVTPYKPMGGYVTDKQLAMVTEFFQSQPLNAVRMVVMHHNLIRSERHKIINDADKILNVFANDRVNIVLSGHIHFACIEQIKKNFLKHILYIVTAGTPISIRTIAPNSYNVIELNEHEFTLTVRSFADGCFLNTSSESYVLK